MKRLDLHINSEDTSFKDYTSCCVGNNSRINLIRSLEGTNEILPKRPVANSGVAVSESQGRNRPESLLTIFS